MHESYTFMSKFMSVSLHVLREIPAVASTTPSLFNGACQWIRRVFTGAKSQDANQTEHICAGELQYVCCVDVFFQADCVQPTAMWRATVGDSSGKRTAYSQDSDRKQIKYWILVPSGSILDHIHVTTGIWNFVEHCLVWEFKCKKQYATLQKHCKAIIPEPYGRWNCNWLWFPFGNSLEIRVMNFSLFAHPLCALSWGCILR